MTGHKLGHKMTHFLRLCVNTMYYARKAGHKSTKVHKLENSYYTTFINYTTYSSDKLLR